MVGWPRPELQGVSGILGRPVPAVHSAGRESGHTVVGTIHPVKERSLSVCPSSGISPVQALLPLEAYVSSFLCNHKSRLSGLIFFFLCFQESRSGETNICVEEIIRVRIFLYKSFQLIRHRF